MRILARTLRVKVYELPNLTSRANLLESSLVIYTWSFPLLESIWKIWWQPSISIWTRISLWNGFVPAPRWGMVMAIAAWEEGTSSWLCTAQSSLSLPRYSFPFNFIHIVDRSRISSRRRWRVFWWLLIMDFSGVKLATEWWISNRCACYWLKKLNILTIFCLKISPTQFKESYKI